MKARVGRREGGEVVLCCESMQRHVRPRSSFGSWCRDGGGGSGSSGNGSRGGGRGGNGGRDG
jgi:hypothetical protein